MSSDDKRRPEGLYMAYLRRLGEQREARGEPPAPDCAPESFWKQRREQEAMKDEPIRKAA
jgi:hypothetical protein